MGDQRGELGNVVSDVGHESLGKGLVLETFEHVIEKAPTKERVVEKFMAWSSRDFERILDSLDPFKIKFLKPTSSLLR